MSKGPVSSDTSFFRGVRPAPSSDEGSIDFEELSPEPEAPESFSLGLRFRWDRY
jgi:hypothetical protein